MKRPLTHLLIAAGAALSLAGCGGASDGAARDSVRAVGSSTVFPFAKAVSESFARSHPEFKSPIIESIGTGGGIAQFCRGLGAQYPDIVNASRRITAQEFATCQSNDVTEITEIQVGLDGIAFATAKDGIDMNLTPEIVYRALAANPYGEPQTAQNWSDVDPSLPNKPILVYGPPSTSGTRDAMTELVLEVGCDANPAMAQLKESDEEAHDRICTEVRTDGKYAEQGEQDNLIVQKITGNRDSIGIFGFSFLEENLDKVSGKRMNGVEPTYENISNFSYPGARPLFIYVKNAHVGPIPGLAEFIEEWTDVWGVDGPLTKIGMVANPADQAEVSKRAATQLIPMTADGLY